ncbi:MAG: FAD-binding oxidoreductase [Xanthomonadales bacterium]|nr:FAD-binding oxidoreductase [Xanthomonadales bacterium]
MSASRGYALAECELQSFDRSVVARCRVQRPDRYRLLEALPDDQPRITRGGGVSYVDAGFGDGSLVQDVGAFDRLLAFDGERGLLTVEAGARIGDVVRFALSRGWIVPVVPGHPGATIGGCIAADVHGKNPARDGTFRDQVVDLELFDPVEGWIGAGAQTRAERFAACFAGFGIPGTIVRATLRLARAPAAYVVRRLPVANLVEAADVLQAHAGAPLLYGWHDGRAGQFGRGVIRFGLEAQDTPRARPSEDLPSTVPPWPLRAWNRAGIAVLDAWIHRRWCRPGSSVVDVASALFPLNGARAYYAGFGKAGFAEAQWLVPHARHADFAAALAELVARTRPRISLIASKLFDGDAEGFSFNGHGIAYAIQCPDPRAAPQRAFLAELANLAIGHGGRPNLIKDSTLDAATVRRAWPDFEARRAALRAFDPHGLQQSGLTRRLAL